MRLASQSGPRGVATTHPQRDTHAMGRERGEQSSPDLFSTDTGRDASRPPPKPPAAEAAAEPASQRRFLPKNLRDAVKYLNDEELDLLRAATLEEIKRRGRAPPSVGADSAQSIRHPSGFQAKRLPPTDKTSQRRRLDVSEISLTRGQVNAVRAAFKAGITPARIARQSGISQSNVRKALASDESKP